MKPVVFRNKGLKIASYWFESPEYNPLKCDIISYHDLREPIIKASSNIIVRNSQTLVNELDIPIDELLSRVQNGTRKCIRRAERAGIVTKFYSSADILEQPKILDEFMEVHKRFLISKNMKGTCNRSQLEAYCRANMLSLSVAAHEGNNIIFHSYIGNGQIARGLYSASLFRNEDQSSKKTLYGDSNRLLHWRDICKFRELGYKIYDWGGYSKLKELQGINQFKETFGGEIKDRHYYMIPNSILGSLAIFMLRFISTVKALKFKTNN
jgi:lipid II:glycine glycyltransferase (peptidoglycan interpeptide bridge formation enzyme)